MAELTQGLNTLAFLAGTRMDLGIAEFSLIVDGVHMSVGIEAAERNGFAWQDLGERMDKALLELGHLDPVGASERIQGKIAGVEGAKAEYKRLEASGEPYVSVFAQWLASHIQSLESGSWEALRSGYALVLDYTRAY